MPEEVTFGVAASAPAMSLDTTIGSRLHVLCYDFHAHLFIAETAPSWQRISSCALLPSPAGDCSST
jgi:hypothetical protein